MRKALALAVVLGVQSFPLGAQAQLTLRGEVVEVSCFTKLGVAKSTGDAHVACAKECVAKGQALGILTDGDGLIKVTGDYAANKYAKLAPYIGQQVEVQGTDDRYLDYSRAIKVAKIRSLAAKPTPGKK